MIYYFAYGSNLHPIRLGERVPSAKLVGTVKLGGHRMQFHKQSHDGSSKCNLLKTGVEPDVVYGAVYAVSAGHKTELDRFEGKGCGYTDQAICVQHQAKPYHCFTYIAQQTYIDHNLKPYHWYKKLVALGAGYLQFPTAYVSAIESVESTLDRNEVRRLENEALIRRIMHYPKFNS